MLSVKRPAAAGGATGGDTLIQKSILPRPVRRAQPSCGVSWWPEGLISLEGLGPLTYLKGPRMPSPEAEESRGGGRSSSMQRASSRRWPTAGDARGAQCAWPGREVGRRGALCEPICRLRGRGFVCWGRPRAGRPGLRLSGRGMRRASRRTPTAHHFLPVGVPVSIYRSGRSADYCCLCIAVACRNPLQLHYVYTMWYRKGSRRKSAHQ